MTTDKKPIMLTPVEVALLEILLGDLIEKAKGSKKGAHLNLHRMVAENIWVKLPPIPEPKGDKHGN